MGRDTSQDVLKDFVFLNPGDKCGELETLGHDPQSELCHDHITFLPTSTHTSCLGWSTYLLDTYSVCISHFQTSPNKVSREHNEHIRLFGSHSVSVSCCWHCPSAIFLLWASEPAPGPQAWNASCVDATPPVTKGSSYFGFVGAASWAAVGQHLVWICPMCSR